MDYAYVEAFFHAKAGIRNYFIYIRLARQRTSTSYF